MLCGDAGAKPDLLIKTPSAIRPARYRLKAWASALSTARGRRLCRTGLILRPFEPAVKFKRYLLLLLDMQKRRLVKPFGSALMEVRNVRHQVLVIAATKRTNHENGWKSTHQRPGCS